MHFSAVLFDFDGILVDTEWAIYEAWHRTFLAHGHPLPLETYTQCIGSDFDTWSPKVHLEELTGRSFDWHQLDENRQVEIRRDLEQAGPMPGVVALLEKLRLASYFREVVCRGDAPRIKPAPDLWLEAVKRLGFPAGECLAIEDSLNGVKSAKAAGLNVWAVPNRTTACLDFSLADRVVASLEEV